MSDHETSPPLATVEAAPRRISWAWVVPFVALGALAWYLFVQVNRERGPRIEITFETAGGIESGSELMHRGMTVGVVREVELTDSLEAVRVTADLAPHAAGLAQAVLRTILAGSWRNASKKAPRLSIWTCHLELPALISIKTPPKGLGMPSPHQNASTMCYWIAYL